MNVRNLLTRNSRRSLSVVVLLLVAAALIVVVNAWLAFRAEEAFSESESWVSHTWQVMNVVERLVGTMKDAETGARGYVLADDPAYLTPYTNALSQMPARVNELEQLTADNYAQQQRVQQLRAVSARRLAILEQTVSLMRRGDPAAALALVRSGTGLNEMEEMRTIAGRMGEDEQRLLAIRLKTLDRARTQARLTVLVASLLDVLFIVLTFFSLRYERKLRDVATATRDRLAKLQVISDVGLTQLSLSELSHEMLARLRSVADADAALLCTWNTDEFGETRPEEAFTITAADGVSIPPTPAIALADGGPLARAAREYRVLKLAGSELQTVPIDSLRREMGTLLIVPLATDRNVTGLLIAGRRRTNAFSEQDEHLFSVVADRIARAMDRARIFEAEREARRLAESSMAEVQRLNADLEERVRLRTLELEATNSELEAFSYSVSHDLRAPLRSVDGFSVALEEDYGDAISADGKHYLARIRAGVQRMGQLIDALLQLSRITRADLTLETVNLSELAAESAAELRQLNPGREIEFRIEEGLIARGDPKLLRVVFDNMFGNAVKFTVNRPRAVVEFGVCTGQRSGSTNGQRRFFIRDNGAGFDQQYANKLFIAFQRLHGEKDFAGSGIGLATVSRVIRRHQGTLSAEGVVGTGATFWFTLG